MTWVHVSRGEAINLSIVHIDVEIGQKGLFGPDPFYPLQGKFKMGMGRMRPVTHRVDDKELYTSHRGERGIGQSHDIIGIGDFPEAEAQRRD